MNPKSIGIEHVAIVGIACIPVAFWLFFIHPLWQFFHGAVVVAILAGAIALAVQVVLHRKKTARRTLARQEAEQAERDAIWERDSATITDQVARCAADLLHNPIQAADIWGELGLGEPGNHPTLDTETCSSGVEETSYGSRVYLLMPSNFANPAAYVSKLPELANHLGVDVVRIVRVTGRLLVLDLVTRDPLTTPQWQQWLQPFPERLHTGLGRIAETWSACELWTRLGLGREPNHRTGDPGSWPTVLPGEHNGIPDSGVWTVPVGACVRLTIPDNCSANDFASKADKIAPALDVPAVRVKSRDGNQLILELRVVDPIAVLAWCPLISVHEVLDADGSVTTRYRPVVAPNSLSCHDDFDLAVSDQGEMVTFNLSKHGHIVIGGRTRSGKSILLNNLVARAMLMRDTKVLMIDPNGAATPPWYRLLHRVCEENDGDAACEILLDVLDEIERRKRIFHQKKIDKITDFSEDLPLWVLAIDEAALFRKHSRFGDLLGKVAAIALKYGIVLIVSLQKVSEDNLPTAVRSQLTNRVSHAVNDAQDFRVLLPTAPAVYAEEVLKLSVPQGVAIGLLASQSDFVRMRGLFLPTQACFDIADAILAVRKPERDLPYQDDEDTDTAETPATSSKPTSTPPKPRTAPASAPRERASEQHASGNILLLDDFRGVRYCLAPDCNNPVPQAHTGRPGKFCSPRCRQIHHRHKNRKQPTED
ncbi:FtsK/SpoIIIE domain-containing protein (plasmid) [Nocardia sp. CA-084685]|uniref:FtsK/SpoIIIE domain-containing protein n=1 Tax=Nocardia sp. CA-084685 TaxID=3239970 RepID=UPI003D96300A